MTGATSGTITTYHFRSLEYTPVFFVRFMLLNHQFCVECFEDHCLSFIPSLLLIIVSCVPFRFTVSDYSSDIFKLFVRLSQPQTRPSFIGHDQSLNMILSPDVFAWATCQVPPVEKEFVNLLEHSILMGFVSINHQYCELLIVSFLGTLFCLLFFY